MTIAPMADIDSRPEGFQRVRAALAQRAHPHEPLWLDVAARTAEPPNTLQPTVNTRK